MLIIFSHAENNLFTDLWLNDEF